MSNCPSDDDLQRYHAKELDAAEEARVREHLSDCEDCAKRSESLLAEHEELLDHVRGMSLPETEKVGREVPIADSASDETLEVRKPGESSFFAPLPDSFPGYTIIREIHRGGQGVVYQALQQSTKRKVAIKVLLEGPYASPSAQKRFEREIELVASLKHANIIEVFHSGITTDGRHFYVMDYVRGIPLHRYVREKQLPLENALKLFSTVCEAVNYAHQKGVIHRDLKPTNILVDSNGYPKVLDFGLAKMVGGPEQTIVSLTGQVVGTLPYMSPEQAKGNPDEIDIRTDVYALGVILYEILTGQYPYPVAGQMADVLKHIAETPPTPPSRSWKRDSGVTKRSTRRVRAGDCPIDDEVQTIVLKTLAKERERRYQSAGELARDIGHYLAGEPIEAKRDSGWYVIKKSLRRYRAAVAVIAAFFVVVVAASLVSLTFWREAAAQRDHAEDARLRAVASLKVAEEARHAESEQRLKAERERLLAVRQSYVANIRAGKASLDSLEIGEAKRRLAACAPDLRGWEWAYLKRKSDCSLAVLRLERFEGFPQRVGFSEKGDRVFCLNFDDVSFWDAHDYVRMDRADEQNGQPDVDRPIAMSPGGLWVVRSGYYADGDDQDPLRKLYYVQDLATDEIVSRLPGKTESFPVVAFSPDGSRFVACGGERMERSFVRFADSLVVWDTATGATLLATNSIVKGQSGGAAFKPDGGQVVVGGDEGIQVLDVPSGQVLMLRELPGEEVTSIAYSPNGSLIASGTRSGTIHLRQSDGLDPYLFLQGHVTLGRGARRGVSALAFSPDGKMIASGSGDRTVRLWDTSTGELLTTFLGHDGEVVSVAFSPDGDRIVSGAMDGTVRVWDAGWRSDLIRLTGEQQHLHSLAVSPRGTQIATGSGRFVAIGASIWDAITGEALSTFLDTRAAGVTSLAFTPDQTSFVTGTEDDRVCFWDIATGELVRVYEGRDYGDVVALAISPDGTRIVSAHYCVLGEEASLRLWDIHTGDLLVERRGYDDDIDGVTYRPDGQRIALASADRHRSFIQIWDASLDKCIFTIFSEPPYKNITSFTFAPDGTRILVGFAAGYSIGSLLSIGSVLQIWDADTGTLVDTLPAHDEGITSVAFSPDGSRFVSAAHDRTVKVWDAESFESLLTFRTDETAEVVAFSPDGRWLVAGLGNDRVRLWDTTAPDDLFARRQRRIAQHRSGEVVVDSLLAKLGTVDKVVHSLAGDQTLDATTRATALRIARLRRNEAAASQIMQGVQDPSTLNNESWQVVRSPTQTEEAYRKAVKKAERACLLLQRHGAYLNTLGVARYRVGAYDRALATLKHSNELNGGVPADLAFIAMAHHQLGHADEAEAALGRLRTLMQAPEHVNDQDAQGFLHEAETLIADLSESNEPTK